MTALDQVKTLLLTAIMIFSTVVLITDGDLDVEADTFLPTREGEEYPILEEGMILRTTIDDKINKSLYPIPQGATVTSSTITFSNVPVEEGGIDYGEDLWVNVGGSTKEYIYPREDLGNFGSWGNSFRTSGDETWRDIAYTGTNGKMRFILPKNATITEAVFNITAHQREDEFIEMDISNNVGNSRFGYNIKDLGDTDNNGYDELLVAAPYASSGTGTVYEVEEDLVTPGNLVLGSSTSAQQSNAHFGMSISDVFEYKDTVSNAIAIGAPDDGLGSEGSVRILSYPGFSRLSSRPTGNSSNEGFGTSLAIMDLDDDGGPELFVGAPRANGGTGAIYIFHVYSTDISLITVINGSAMVTGFGKQMTVGDMNGDEIDDLAVASDDDITLFLGSDEFNIAPDGTFDPLTDSGENEFGPIDMIGPTGPARNTLAVGVPTSLSGSVLLYDAATGSVDTTLDATVTPASSTPGFGSSIAGGDLDVDGANELIFGTPGTSSTQGQVSIFKRGSGLWRTLPVGGSTGDSYGFSLEVCDLRGMDDMFPDVIIGAPQFFGTTSTGPGHLYVHEYYDIDSLPDNKPSLQIGGTTGWMAPENKVSGQFYTGDISSTINDFLDDAVEDFHNLYEGFVYVDISFVSATQMPSEGSNHFNITEFRILFDQSIRLEDLNTQINNFISTSVGDDVRIIDEKNYVMVPIVFSSQTPGAVKFDTIDIQFDEVPYIEERPTDVHMDEDTLEEKLIDLYAVFEDDNTLDPYLDLSARTTGQNRSKASVSIKDHRYLSVDLTVGPDDNGDGERDNANWSGELEVIIDVIDDLGGILTTSDPFIINVDEVNDAPAISDEPITLAVQDELFSYTPGAVDDENDDIYYMIDLDSSPENMTVDQEFGSVTWRPGPWEVGTVNWTFILTDNITERRYTFQLNVDDVPDNPIFMTPPPVVEEGVTVGLPFEYDFYAVDPDIDDRITYILVYPIQGAVIDLNTGRFTYTPPRHFLDPVEFVVRARDSNGLHADIEFTLNTTFTDSAPELLHEPELTLFDTQEWTFNMTVNDAEEHRIDVDIVVKPEGLKYDIVTPQLIWTPTVNQLGTFNLSIKITSTSFDLYFNYTLEVLRSTRTWDFTLEGIETGKTFSGNVQIGGQLDVSPSQIDRVEVKIGENDWMPGIIQSGRWSIDIDTSKYDDGEYLVQIRGYDGAVYSETQTITMNFENEEETTSPLIFIIIILAIIIIIALLVGGFFVYKKVSSEKEQKEIKERQVEAIQASKRSMDDFLQETGGDLEKDVDYADINLNEEVEGEGLEKIDEIFQPLNIPHEEMDENVEVPEDPLQNADLSEGPVLEGSIEDEEQADTGVPVMPEPPENVEIEDNSTQ